MTETSATVHGAACKKCGSTERYAKSGRCAPCRKAAASAFATTEYGRMLGRARHARLPEERRIARRQSERRYARTPKGRAVKRAAVLKWAYGITPEEVALLIEKQGGRCAICGDPPGKRALDIDHDHNTRQVRGLLCHRCNVGIGKFHDNQKLLRAAIKYLDQNAPVLPFRLPSSVNHPRYGRIFR